MDNRIIESKEHVLKPDELWATEDTDAEIAADKKELLRKEMNDECRRIGLAGANVLLKRGVLTLAPCDGKKMVQEEQRIVQLESRHLVLKCCQFVLLRTL